VFHPWTKTSYRWQDWSDNQCLPIILLTSNLTPFAYLCCLPKHVNSCLLLSSYFQSSDHPIHRLSRQTPETVLHWEKSALHTLSLLWSIRLWYFIGCDGIFTSLAKGSLADHQYVHQCATSSTKRGVFPHPSFKEMVPPPIRLQWTDRNHFSLKCTVQAAGN